MENTDQEKWGQVAYQQFRKALPWPTKPWHELTPSEKFNWESAAQQVVAKVRK